MGIILQIINYFILGLKKIVAHRRKNVIPKGVCNRLFTTFFS